MVLGFGGRRHFHGVTVMVKGDGFLACSFQACSPALLGFRDSGTSLVKIRTQIERALQFGDCRRIVILLEEINAIAVGSSGLFAASAPLLDIARRCKFSRGRLGSALPFEQHSQAVSGRRQIRLRSNRLFKCVNGGILVR